MNRTLILAVIGTAALRAQDASADLKKKIDQELVAVKREMAAKMALMGPVIEGAPYSATAVTESVQVLTDGTRIEQRSSYRIHRDSAGRVAREEEAKPGSGVFQVVSIHDPVAGVSYMIDWRAQSAREIPLKMAAKLAPGIERKTQLTAEEKRADELKREAEQKMEVFKAKRPPGEGVAAVYGALPVKQARRNEALPA